MELFFEFSLTLFLSFLFSFLVSKLLSDSSNTCDDDDYLGAAFNGVKAQRTRTRKVRAEKRVGFISDFVQVDEFTCRNGRIDDGSVVAAPTNEGETTISGKFAEPVMDCDEIETLGLGGGEECEIVEVAECADDVVEMGWVNADKVFDEWQGVERSELERLFGAAVAYVGSTTSAANCRTGNDLKLQLYGLHKIAIDGPCRAPQPMALKVSARAKWNSWQQLGDMDRDEAMQHYINLLSSHIPEWRETLLQEHSKQDFAVVETNNNFLLGMGQSSCQGELINGGSHFKIQIRNECSEDHQLITYVIRLLRFRR